MNQNTKTAFLLMEAKGIIEIEEWAQVLKEYPQAVVLAADKFGIERQKVFGYIKSNRIPTSDLLPVLKELK